MMNILFVNNFRGRGGGEEFLRDLLPGLAEKGIQVGLVCRPDTPLVEMFQGSSVRLYPTHRSGIAALTSPFKIARIIREGRYEIVNIQRGHDIIQSLIASLISFRRPVLIYTPQVPEFLRSRFLLKRIDSIVTISRYIRDKIISFVPILADRVRIIHYGIDVDSFSPAMGRRGALRKRWGITDDVKIIGTVGDLWKNQIEFLDSLVAIRKAVPGAMFALVASESENSNVLKFRDHAARLGLSKAVIWAGRLSKAEMKAFYADIDVAVSTHRNEGFGIWVLEALAMGKAMVAFNEGGIRDSLEGCPSGVLVNGGAKEMAQEILRILKDKDIRRKISAAGPGWVAERFSRERMVGDYAVFFETIAKGKG